MASAHDFLTESPTIPTQPQPDVVGEIVLLKPEQIDASDRLRPIDPVWADALGGVMQVEGQRTPIEVCRLPGRSDYKLVVGGHRHAAASLKGLWLRCEVVTADATDRRLREVSENLHRRDLAPMDRAAFVAELVAVHKTLAGLNVDQDGRAASANARWQNDIKNDAIDATATIAIAYGWTDKVAEILGLASRTIRDDLMLFRRIPASAIDALRSKDHPVLSNASQLRALAKLDKNDQEHILGLLLHSNGVHSQAPFSSVTAAVAAVSGKSKPTPDSKRLNAFLGAFGRMTPLERKGALVHLKEVLPAGWSLTEVQGGAA